MTHTTKQYVGIRVDSGEFERFAWSDIPTQETHGHIYSAVIGPFRTARGAKFMALYGRGNPHLQTVANAECVAKDHSRR